MFQRIHYILNISDLKPVEYVNIFELGRWSLFLWANYLFNDGSFFSNVSIYRGLQDVGGVLFWATLFTIFFSVSVWEVFARSVALRKLTLVYSTWLWFLLVWETFSLSPFVDSILLAYLLLGIINIYTYIRIDNESG